MIETKGLTRVFGNHIAVDRLTLEIAAGEIFGFLGPNGAGKTTTVRMLASLIAPSAGSARVAGYEVGKDDRNIRRNVGILTEAPGMYDRLSAWRNLLIYAQLYEVQNPEKQVEKYLGWLGLWDRRNDPAGSFSKGMKQKLAIARALLHEPKMLFLDEPTAGLDPGGARMVRDFIETLSETGRTIFLCTHNLDEADRLCDRVAVFNTELRVLDTPEGLRRKLYGRQVAVHLANEAEQFIETAKALEFVKDAAADDGSLILTMDEPDTNNPVLVQRLVAAGAQIKFVGEIRYSLEDIYLELVKRQ